MLRFIAEQNDVSQQKVLNRIVIPELVKQAEELDSFQVADFYMTFRHLVQLLLQRQED
jgi:hypothetical protein